MTEAPGAADELFDLPAGEFVAARDALARRLKPDDAQLAAAVKALRRPTVAAWAVNQAVRSNPGDFAALVAAGTAVQRAQRKAMSGLRDTGMREATEARRAHVIAMTDLARAALGDVGASADTHLAAISATFEAASSDPNTSDRVGAGRLSAPVTPATDFAGLTGLLGLSVAAASEGASDDPPPGDARDEHATERRDAMRAVEDARRRAEAAQRALDAAQQAADSLAERATSAQRRADDALAAAERSQAAAGVAAERAREAAEDRVKAHHGVEAARQEHQRARAALDALA